MILYGSLASPFVRKVRVVLLEGGLNERVPFREMDLANPPQEFLAVAPVQKIPVLVLADGEALIESDLICRHLVHKYQLSGLFPENWSDEFEQFLAVVNEAANAAVDIIRELRRPQEMISEAHLERFRSRVARILGWLDNRASLLADLPRFAGIATACALGYIEFRRPEIVLAEAAPALYRWYQDFSKQPALVATAPR